MRKTIGKRFKCLKNVVRIIVVRVLRSFRHNLGYDLGNPRAASAGADGPKHHPTLSNSIQHLRISAETFRTGSNIIRHHANMVA